MSSEYIDLFKTNPVLNIHHCHQVPKTNNTNAFLERLKILVFQAAVRSSRRKRNQYVVDLRDLVTDLKRRKSEALTQNDLLQKLISLWERLCSEVESEIQDGVRQQLNLTIPDLDHNSISIPSEEEINSRLLSIRDAAKFAANEVNQTEDLMTNLFSNTESVLHFDTDDRGAMEL